MKIFVAILVMLVAAASQAANVYVRDGGSGDGSAWNNALDDLPAELNRGDTYYVADGNYSGYTFNDPNSGTTLITIKKATIADHGTETGWDNSYGDGQAFFNGTLKFDTDYYVVDGQTRANTGAANIIADWMNASSYGFKFRQAESFSDGASSGDQITIRYSAIGSIDFDPDGTPNAEEAVYWHGPDMKYDVTISHCLVHNASFMQMAIIDGILVEYTMFAYGHAKEAFRGQYLAKNGVLRFNIFWQSSLAFGGDNPTAPIAIWDDSDNGEGSFDNWEIYGNLIVYTNVPNISDAAIAVGGGAGWAGVAANNVKIYNNTIVGFGADEPADIEINGNSGGTGNEIRNNLWYDCSQFIWTASSATASDNGSQSNSVAGTVFVNAAAYDFRLDEAVAGTALSSPYNTDLLGNTREPGSFDRGAFEFIEGEPEPELPTLVANLIATNVFINHPFTLTGYVANATWHGFYKDSSFHTATNRLVLPASGNGGLYYLVGTNETGAATSSVVRVFPYQVGSGAVSGSINATTVVIGQ